MGELHYLLDCLKAEPANHVKPLSRRLGIPYGTLRKLRSGKTTNPRYSTVERLRSYYLSAARLENPVLQPLQATQWFGPDRRQMG